MDSLASGGHAIIDYKTGGNITPRRWDPPRPDEPQLALYAVAAKEEITAVAFAKVRPGEMRFMGYSRDDKALPEVRRRRPGSRCCRRGRTRPSRSARSFAGGDAGVDPKKDLIDLPLLRPGDPLAASTRRSTCCGRGEREW
jgi:hypothetical protein